MSSIQFSPVHMIRTVCSKLIYSLFFPLALLSLYVCLRILYMYYVNILVKIKKEKRTSAYWRQCVDLPYNNIHYAINTHHHSKWSSIVRYRSRPLSLFLSVKLYIVCEWVSCIVRAGHKVYSQFVALVYLIFMYMYISWGRRAKS